MAEAVTISTDGWQVFYLVPVIGICFNIFPVNNSFWFALAFTLYIFMIQVRGLPCSFFATSRMLAGPTAAYMLLQCIRSLVKEQLAGHTYRLATRVVHAARAWRL